MASSRMRSSTDGSVIRRPSASRYSKPWPRRRRRMPVSEQSTLRRRAMAAPMPARRSAATLRRLAGSKRARDSRSTSSAERAARTRERISRSSASPPGSATVPPASLTISCAAATSTERTSRRDTIASRRPPATRHSEAATEPSARRRRAPSEPSVSAAAATRSGRAVSRPSSSSGPGSSAREALAVAEGALAAHRPPVARGHQLGDEADLDVAHARPGRDGDRHARERQPPLGVDRAVDRVDDDPGGGRPVAQAHLPALLRDRDERDAERLQLGEHGVLGRLVDRERRVAALALPVRHRPLGRARHRRHGVARRVRGAAAEPQPICVGKRHPAAYPRSRMPDLLDGLNANQRAVVTHPGGPLLVVAGAGTGKTRTLTRRFAWLVEQGTPADCILALTFSSPAAAEMRERLETLLDAPYEELNVSTFHSFCLKLLRDEALEACVDPFLSPVTPADRLALLLERIGELSLRHHEIRGNPAPLLASFVSRIDRLKDELISADELRAWAEALPASDRRRARPRLPRARVRAPLRRPRPPARRARGARLRRPDRALVQAAAREAARARAHRQALPARARGRVPGHELRPGHAAAAARRGALERHRRRRRRPGHLPLPRGVAEEPARVRARAARRRRRSSSSATSAPAGASSTPRPPSSPRSTRASRRS